MTMGPDPTAGAMMGGAAGGGEMASAPMQPPMMSIGKPGQKVKHKSHGHKHAAKRHKGASKKRY